MWGASHPTFWKAFPGPRGRPDLKNAPQQIRPDCLQVPVRPFARPPDRPETCENHGKTSKLIGKVPQTTKIYQHHEKTAKHALLGRVWGGLGGVLTWLLLFCGGFVRFFGGPFWPYKAHKKTTKNALARSPVAKSGPGFRPTPAPTERRFLVAMAAY